LAVTTVPMLGQPCRPTALKVRRRQIVEDQIHVERKQRPQSQKQLLLELWLVPAQPVQRPVPLAQLLVLHAHPWTATREALRLVTPRWQPASTRSVTHIGRLQPPGHPVFARRGAQPTRHQG